MKTADLFLMECLRLWAYMQVSRVGRVGRVVRGVNYPLEKNLDPFYPYLSSPPTPPGPGP